VIDAGEILRFLAAFAVIGILLLAFALVSRNGGRLGAFLRCNRGRIVEVIETTPLPNAGSLHVVKMGAAFYVIGRTDHAISLLSEIPKEIIDQAKCEAPVLSFPLLPVRRC
jgi:flagellar biogenesis protein FliO